MRRVKALRDPADRGRGNRRLNQPSQERVLMRGFPGGDAGESPANLRRSGPQDRGRPRRERPGVRLLHSPYGSSQPAEFRLPFQDRDAHEILRSLAATISQGGDQPPAPSRHLNLSTQATSLPSLQPHEIGQALFDALFVGAIRENLLSSLGLIGSRDNLGLRIRLVIDPVLADQVGCWPWELLYRRETRDFLSRDLRTPIVRQLEVQRPSLAPTPISKLRVLVALSNPEGVAPLDVAGERKLIESAVGPASGIELRFLERPTIEALRAELRDAPFEVLHFVGHGDLDAGGQGTIFFEDSRHQARAVSAAVLADTLKSLTPVRLVFLNACETARLPRNAAGHDPFLGTAAALIMAGLPAVVAMQFSITDRAALSFSSAFYRNLAAGDPLESAVAEGRMAILQAEPSSWEWATPVLFLGVPHGQFFSVEAGETPRTEAQRSVEAATPPVLERALDLLEHGRYDGALEALGRGRQANPDDPAAAYYVALARLQGHRPRSCRLDVIKKCEGDLEAAIYLAGDAVPAHLWYLQALIKHDFYRFKGLKIRPPSIEDLLVEARAAAADPAELQRLLQHVPTPPNPVNEAIAERLAQSGGG